MVEANLRGTTVIARWKHLWHHNPADPLGGFAIYFAGSDAQQDEALRQIWAAEDLPKPHIAGAWTPDRVRQWVDDYSRRFADLTTMILSAKTPGELKSLTEYAQSAGVKVIYLHTDTWRGEYWPKKNSHVAVNTDVFPNGRADLKRYAADLHKHGMFLLLHYVCGGIGPSDPKRVLGHVDRNLASWGKGRLAEPIDEKTRRIRFRPEPGTHFPLMARIEGRDVVGDHTQVHFVRIDDEIVRVGAFEDLDKPVWTLKPCERGYGGTPVTAHAAGAESAGLFSAYGQNFIPDVDSPLLEEMAREYASFANEIGLDFLEFDGYEIHNHVPWGARKFSDLVFRNLDHAVGSNTSGGRPVASNLEMLFSSVRKINQFGYASVNLSLQLDGHRPATSLLDANFELQAGLAKGARRFVILKPEPMFGVSENTLRTHGQVEPMMAAFRNWKTATQRLNEVQWNELAKSVEPIRNRLKQAGGHVQGKDVYCIRENGSRLELIPTRVMIRKEGDVPWRIGQEFGPTGPRQFCQPGEVLQLENPFMAQPAGFVIHVLPELGGTGARVSGGSAPRIANNAVLDSYRTGAEAARHADITGTGGVASLTSIQPKASEIRQQRHAAFKQEGEGLIVTAENATGEDRWIEDGLPYWRKSFSMENTRAIGLDITGDGSGAVFVLQMRGRGVRDYVIKLNFTGKRTIIIPNGEVAWASGYWGWRFAAKYFEYAGVGQIDLGFGYIPARSHPRVKIENLRLVPERPCRLTNPIVHTGAGTLRVSGEIETGQHLEYSGGAVAVVYDKNWNRLKELKVTAIDYTMPHGFAPVKVEAQEGTPRPWLDVRFITKGEPVVVPGK